MEGPLPCRNVWVFLFLFQDANVSLTVVKEKCQERKWKSWEYLLCWYVNLLYTLYKAKRVPAYYLKPLNCINKCQYNPAQLRA